MWIDGPSLGDSADGDDTVVVVDEGDGDIREPGHGSVHRVLRKHDDIHAVGCVGWHTVGEERRGEQEKLVQLFFLNFVIFLFCYIPSNHVTGVNVLHAHLHLLFLKIFLDGRLEIRSNIRKS